VSQQVECALCHGVFDKDTSDEEMAVKSRALLGIEPAEIVCDDCICGLSRLLEALNERFKGMTEILPPSEFISRKRFTN
jgi:hypothetical protein